MLILVLDQCLLMGMTEGFFGGLERLRRGFEADKGVSFDDDDNDRALKVISRLSMGGI